MKIPEYVRGYLYRVILTVLPILVAYGVIAEDRSGLWVALVGALLGTVPAAIGTANTSTRRECNPPE